MLQGALEVHTEPKNHTIYSLYSELRAFGAYSHIVPL